jgi:hypothetical protein
MKEILDLYKIHINENPDGAEIHRFFTMFDLGGMIITNPNPVIDQLQEIQRQENINHAKNYIFKKKY